MTACGGLPSTDGENAAVTDALGGLAWLLQSARPLLQEAWDAHLASAPMLPASCVLFFSASTGTERAHVLDARGAGLEEAWQDGMQQSRRFWGRKDKSPVWLRVDIACKVRRIAWQRLRARLSETKRNYWRCGIAFDAGLAQALLPMECSGNALLYDNRFPVATPNDNNLGVYSLRRFSQELQWPNDPSQPMWIFDVRGVFTDGRSAHVLEHAGRHHGYRRIPEWGASSVHDLVRRGTAYLARQVMPGGQYHYGWFPCFDRPIPTYNALRHASSTYALLEGWELTGDQAHKRAIDAALEYLCGALIHQAALPDGRTAAFLVDTGGEIKLGGNAVCLLALVKYTELTGDRSHLPLLERLALGIVHMQDAQSGRFVHVLHWPTLQVKAQDRIIYYDGEAAFGLMRLYGLTGDRRWVATVEKAFDYFIAAEHWRAHDHWLSYCVNELTLYRTDARYYRFGLDNVRDHLDFVLERITTFPTLLELMMAAREMIMRIQRDPQLVYLLDGFDLDKFQRALEARARYLSSGFFWPELAMFFSNPARIIDGFFIKHHSYRVRIDDVEHYLSGYVAYWKYLDARMAGIATEPTFALPADLHGRQNGQLEQQQLRPIIGGHLHWRAARAWDAMRAAALADGVLLEPTHHIDTYRPLQVQERMFLARHTEIPQPNASPLIWQGRAWWLKPGIAEAKVPGTSNHGWGLAIDVHRSRQPARRHWLQRHASRFGWNWPMPGEPWHLDYCGGDAELPDIHAFWLEQASSARTRGARHVWDAAAVRTATAGTWLRLPRDSDWGAAGLCSWAPSMRPGCMVAVRSQISTRGVPANRVRHLLEDASAVIVDGSLPAGLPAHMPVLRVENMDRAIRAMGTFARSRIRGKLIGVTGSAGKTTTVAMLGDMLQAYGEVNRTRDNANLPPGVAWNLASMDWDAPFTVLEMAVGRMGESARMARPDVALVTNVTAAHLEYHGTVDEVARRKARIFSGMLPGGTAVLNRDLPQWRIFAQQAARFGLSLLHYGRHDDAQFRLLGYEAAAGRVHAIVDGIELEYTLGAPGEHMALNSLACLGALNALKLPMEPALRELAGFRPLSGRGQRHDIVFDGKRLLLVDEAYNANPASMDAALRLIGQAAPPLPGGRRVLVLGDMLELGPDSARLHAALAAQVLAARSELVLLCGEYMVHLAAALGESVPCLHAPDADALIQKMAGLLCDGDLVLVKGSAGTRLSKAVERLLGQDTGR